MPRLLKAVLIVAGLLPVASCASDPEIADEISAPIVAALESYRDGYERALAAPDAPGDVSAWAAEPHLSKVRTQFEVLAEAGLVGAGHTTDRFEVRSVTDGQAEAVSCGLQNQIRMQYRDTGQPADRTKSGVALVDYKLTRGPDGLWRVSGVDVHSRDSCPS